MALSLLRWREWATPLCGPSVSLRLQRKEPDLRGYFVDPGLLRTLNFVGGTTLKRIEPHRLAALIVEDVGRYPKSKIGDIHERIGLEIPRSHIRRGIEQQVKAGKLMAEGVKSGTRYRLP